VKQMVVSAGSAEFNLSRTDAWPSCSDAGLALASEKEQCSYSARVFGAERTNSSATSFLRSAPFSVAIQGKSQSSGTTLQYRA